MAALEKDARLARNGLVRPGFGKLRTRFGRLRAGRPPSEPVPVGKIVEIKGIVPDAVSPGELP